MVSRPVSLRTLGRKKRPIGANLCRHLKKYRKLVRISYLFYYF